MLKNFQLSLFILVSCVLISSCRTQPPERAQESLLGVQPQRGGVRHYDFAALQRDRFLARGDMHLKPDPEMAEEEEEEENNEELVLTPALKKRIELFPPRASVRNAESLRPSASSLHIITMKRWFVEKYKYRATMTTMFSPVASTKHTVASDGDAHVAALVEEPVMTMVGEVMNWRDVPAALKEIEEVIQKGGSVEVSGVWRLWCEHPGTMDHVQDSEVPDYSTFRHRSNPDHVFEIHPLTRFGSEDLSLTVHPIPDGYKTKAAKEAFEVYERLPCELLQDEQSITIKTVGVGYNYPECKLRVTQSPTQMLDGVGVQGEALDLDGRPVADHEIRFVFVQNSPPELALRGVRPGTVLHILGMPRVDLGVVAERVAAGSRLGANLPYEIVVVGVYQE
jgi:hypothetical protein